MEQSIKEKSKIAELLESPEPPHASTARSKARTTAEKMMDTRTFLTISSRLLNIGMIAIDHYWSFLEAAGDLIEYY